MSHWEPVLTDVVRYRGGSLLRHATLLCGNERHRLYTVNCEEPVSGLSGCHDHGLPLPTHRHLVLQQTLEATDESALRRRSTGRFA
jgi:hypothetical protein